MVSVAGVDEGQRIEAAAGDLLFLKGQNYPGLYGESDTQLAAPETACIFFLFFILFCER